MNDSIEALLVTDKVLSLSTCSLLPPEIATTAQIETELLRMFRDPYQLEKAERVQLICDLRSCVEAWPEMSDVRVLLGMALCVDFQAQEALEVLRQATQCAPDNFAARLKFGELLMRLRICDQAEEQTREAARLARNPMQSELAGKQAKQIRTMRREGVERGGITRFWSRIASWRSQIRPRGKSRSAAILSSR